MSTLLAWPIGLAYHIVLTIAHVLTPAAGPLATAAAIVAFTMAVRLILLPLSFSALRGQARIAAIQPRVQALRTRYARQPDRLQTELSSLYAQEAGGMLAGCLPLLVQVPFFSVMYRLFVSRTVGGQANALLSRDLFGTPLGSHLFSGAVLAFGHVLVFAGLLALLVVVATLAVRAARSAAAAARAQQAGAAGLMLKLLPYATVVFAALVPLAAGIYLLTSTGWSAAERVLLRRRIAAAPREPRPAGGSIP